MSSVTLGEFIRLNQEEIVLRCRARAAQIGNWPSTDAELDRGIPLFLEQLTMELGRSSSQTTAIRRTAVEHGEHLFSRGFTVSQVVHDYGNVCQSVTDLAMEQMISISTDDFRTLNRCLDDAIAGAVSEYTRQQALTGQGPSHDLRILISAAITAFEMLQTGKIGVAGTTGSLVHRTLLDMRTRLRTDIEAAPERLQVD
jgi:hypothetical protein